MGGGGGGGQGGGSSEPPLDLPLCIFQHKTALDTLLDWYQENETRDSEFLTIYNNVVELMKEKIPGKG